MMPFLPTPCRQKGAALISILAALLLFSILAAAIVPMVSTSSRQSVAGNQSAKAYLLAESGYRYAASTFLRAGVSEHDQNQSLENLDGDYVLSNNEGSFTLKVFSYFYELTLPVTAGDRSFKALAPGNFPDAFALPEDTKDGVELESGLKIKIGDDTYTLASNSRKETDDTVTFNVVESMKAYPDNTLAYPVAFVDTDRTPTLDDGGDVAYDPDDARMFPLRNGTIQINGRTLTYRFNDRDTNQFEHVKAPDYPEMDDFDLSAAPGEDPEIILARYVRLHATGIYGSRTDTDEQIRRRVVYYTALPLSRTVAQPREYTDRFTTDENWSDTHGTVSSHDVDGNAALTVDSASTTSGQKSALTTLEPGSDAAKAANFKAAQRGTRGYLSYDTQIKVGYEPPRGVLEADPDLGYDLALEDPVPAYVGAGLSFRLTDTADLFSNNGYGLSILRAHSGVSDKIPDELLPLDDERALVLWRQTGDGDARTWLAYKRLCDPLLGADTEPLLHEDNETVDSNALILQDLIIGATNLWDVGSWTRQRADSTRNWSFERTESATARDSGALRTGRIPLPADADSIYLNFWGWHRSAPSGATRRIRITIFDPFTTLDYYIGRSPRPDIIEGPTLGWYRYQIDLSTYGGYFIRIQFSFDTGGEAFYTPYEGWYIDDVQLNTRWSKMDLQEATLALSIKEAMVVPFCNGTEKINAGDRIVGSDNNNSGIVLMPPMISSGSWEGRDASGTLLLNNTTAIDPESAFSFNEELNVISGTGKAKVNDWDGPNDKKADLLFVYLATQNGRGDPGSVDKPTPADLHTLPYDRLGPSNTDVTKLQWPPVLNNDGQWTDSDGSWSASEDYFQLIEWDAVNSDASGLSQHPFTVSGQGIVKRAVLQSHHEELQTPAPGTYGQPEIGLHAFGDGADNIFFDDFGIRLMISESTFIPSPIQQ